MATSIGSLQIQFSSLSLSHRKNNDLEEKITTLTALLSRIHHLFYKTMRNIPHQRLKLVDLQKQINLCASILHDINAYAEACNTLQPHLFDELQIDYQNPYLQENKVSEVISGLDLQAPLIPHYHDPIDLDQTTHQTFFRPINSLALRTQTVAASRFLLKFKNALNFYSGFLNSLRVCKQVLVSEYAYIPRKTKSFILRKTTADLDFSTELFLARGTYGHIYSTTIDSQCYAIKRFLPEKEQDQKESEEYFDQECALHACLPPRDSIISLECIYFDRMILEYADNKTLHDCIKSPFLSYKEIKEYFYSIADALEHIHRCGFNYKDLKSNNVLLFSNPPRAKLCDFGFMLPSESDHETVVHQCYGAPEIPLSSPDNPITTRADCWSFGVLLFYTLTGGLYPFFHDKRNDDDYLNLVSSKRKDRPCTKRVIFKELHEKVKKILHTRDPEELLSDIIINCLHGDPAMRPSMTEIKEKLHSIPIAPV